MKQIIPCGHLFAADFVSPDYKKKYLLRSFFATLLLMIFILPVNSQPLTGTKTIPGDYATIKTAVNALNTYGVGTGGVTFNVSAGYSESLASDSIYITASGTASNPIVFQKSGSGSNPCVTRTDAGTKTTSSIGGNGDAVIIIEGSDYITFNAIDVTASNSGIEYGYYVRKASATDGCKYLTIKNCVITMTKGTSAYVIGLYTSNNIITSSLSSSAGVTVTAESGRHENVTITGNTVQNTFAGMYFVGYNHTVSPYNFYDQNFVIGAEGEGNTIKNFGGNAASTVNGINIIYHNNESIAYNTINNTDGGNTGFTTYGNGILLNTGKAVTINVSYNTISLTNTSAATGKYLYCIQVNAGDASSNITINNNTFQNCVVNGTGAFSAIYHGTVASINIYGNTISGITGVSSLSLINNYAGTGTNFIYNNKISDVTSTGASAVVTGVNIAKGKNSVYNNLICNLFATNSASADAVRGIAISSATALSYSLIYYNSVYLNASSSGTTFGTSCIYHIYSATSTTSSLDMRNNIFVNTSTANGTGVTAAFKRNAATDLNNYLSTSNNNLFYAGTPGASNLIYYDGTNSDQTIETFKARVTPRETNSYTGDPLYHSPANLYVVPVSQAIESGTFIPDYTIDCNGTIRDESAPTIGAYEVSSNAAVTSGTAINPAASTNNVIISATSQGGLTINPSSDLTGYVKGYFFPAGNTGAPPAGIINISPYYWALSTNVTSFTASVRFYFNYIPNNGVSSYATLKLLKRDGPGDNWVEYTNVTRTETYIQANDLTSFSEWSFGGVLDNPLPVLLSSFNYTVLKNCVTLKWTTNSETGNSGFSVERKNGDFGNWETVSFVPGKGNSGVPVNYNYSDINLNTGKYGYRLKQIDNNGNFEYFYLSSAVSVGIPDKFNLGQNYPNPFNPSTSIDFNLPNDETVLLTIYDVTGKEIQKLLNNVFYKAGYHTVKFNASGIASGIYFYRIKAGNYILTKKLLFNK